MADTNMNKTGNQSGTPTNQTLNQERAKAEVSGSRSSEQGSQFDKNKEKSAIGGGENRSETGEPGRARNELDQNQKEPAGGSHQR